MAPPERLPNLLVEHAIKINRSFSPCVARYDSANILAVDRLTVLPQRINQNAVASLGHDHLAHRHRGDLLGTLGAKNPAARTRSLRIAVVTGVIALFVVILGSTTIVSARNVGVVTTFGRPSGTLSNGLHWKAPWQSVTEMDGTIQIDNHTGESATTVRLGNNSTAYVDNSVRWRIQPAAADELFLDYRQFANVRDNLVTRELRAALNEVFADFDPLSLGCWPNTSVVPTVPAR